MKRFKRLIFGVNSAAEPDYTSYDTSSNQYWRQYPHIC